MDRRVDRGGAEETMIGETDNRPDHLPGFLLFLLTAMYRVSGMSLYSSITSTSQSTRMARMPGSTSDCTVSM